MVLCHLFLCGSQKLCLILPLIPSCVSLSTYFKTKRKDLTAHRLANGLSLLCKAPFSSVIVTLHKINKKKTLTKQNLSKAEMSTVQRILIVTFFSICINLNNCRYLKKKKSYSVCTFALQRRKGYQEINSTTIWFWHEVSLGMTSWHLLRTIGAVVSTHIRQSKTSFLQQGKQRRHQRR